jgi:hypothetical protein
VTERPKPPAMRINHGGRAMGGYEHPKDQPCTWRCRVPVSLHGVVEWLIGAPKPAEEPRPMTDAERAEHWRKVTWPATRNYILDLSRY